jgi:predicted lactoylglutathione lyase
MDDTKPEPPTHLDGTPVDQDEIAKAREIINTNGVEFAPGVEDELAAMGLTKDDIIAMLLGSLGGKQ